MKHEKPTADGARNQRRSPLLPAGQRRQAPRDPLAVVENRDVLPQGQPPRLTFG